jgi:hypothetical protein
MVGYTVEIVGVNVVIAFAYGLEATEVLNGAVVEEESGRRIILEELNDEKDVTALSNAVDVKELENPDPVMVPDENPVVKVKVFLDCDDSNCLDIAVSVVVPIPVVVVVVANEVMVVVLEAAMLILLLY